MKEYTRYLRLGDREDTDMARTITVKGIGRATAKPDYVELSLSLESKDLKYDRAMEQAAQSIRNLTDAFVSIGFEKDALKTTNFNVTTDYDSVKDRSGNYIRKFNGYVVRHGLKLGFDLDMALLPKCLSAAAGCLSNPDLSISFTVKDATALNEEMLRSATANARRKAEVLCMASGVKLGKLLTIDYNWSELDIYSRTRYDMAEDCLAMPIGAAPVDIVPDDIDVSDTAAFVWEIE